MVVSARRAARRRGLWGRLPWWVWVVVAVAGVALGAWGLTDRYLTIQRTRIADAKAWAIAGPPCPRITEAEFLDGSRKPIRTFDYDEVTFLRRDGHVDCAPIYDDGGRSTRFHAVCQFTNPESLQVRTKAGEWAFRPGPGKPATVSTANDEARCVMAAKITRAEMEARR
ncbi:MAG: hypothetical protein KKE02_07215 [Alphaproteobacteria bacterium]|nr:hypothetical protein [Alphaproteobacteria bacterium]MBU1515553.1 hypothetical protein [Alphaproteobacteria bacterium]MBU2095551.1 hypothetical protein [Alphaproteobacteria bacterium]MBU2150792.1 hypothetical protein [Alphaproteobacteria bacterium]MBU2307057.1 hypothetical protein [Alphaproteobacteria bacterium]